LKQQRKVNKSDNSPGLTPGLIYCITGTQKALYGPFKAFYGAYFIAGYYTGIPLKRSKTPKFAFLCFR
jgi:hypothetical protein